MSIKGFTDIGGGRKAISVDHDPTSVATDVPMGSLIIDANGKIYRKVDDGATTKVVCAAGHKCNDTATVAPGVDDDVDLGYSVGSFWYDITADKAYVCLDATDGAAVWSEITQVADEKYVDRGDASAWDFLVGDFTADATWRDLDLSGVVPAAGASHLVHLRLSCRGPGVGNNLYMRENGNANAVNAVQLIQVVADTPHSMDAWVMMDAGRIVEYMATDVVWTALSVLVRGWMEAV